MLMPITAKLSMSTSCSDAKRDIGGGGKKAMAKCSGIRADGGRCGAQAIRGEEHCLSHHPDQAAARRRRASKGGKRGGRGRPQVELASIKQRLSDLADSVLEGEVDVSIGRAVSYILSVYLSAISVELKAKEQLELVERLEALEESIERQRKSQGSKRWGA